MKINIQTPGFNAKKELLDFTFRKAAKLFLLYDQLIRVEIVLKVRNSFIQEGKAVHIRMVIPGNDLIATSVGKSFEEAVIQTIDALKEQLRKRKSRQRAFVDNSVNIL